jgi:outer membrane protein OmpA-like peptidoglycan-associated protein
MKIKSKIINCGLALAFTSGIATAQEEPKETKSLMEKYPKLENLYFGLGAGTSIALTDIKQHAYWPAFNPVNEYALGGHGFWGYQLNNIFSVEGSLFLGNLKGQDRDKSLWFNGNITELGINGKINLSNISFSNKIVNRKFNVYAKGGFGFAWFKSELRVLGNGDENDVLVQTEGYESRFNTDNPNRTVSGLLNVGIGASYKLTKKVDIFAETNLRLMDTDKLDAWVSQNNDAHNYNSIGVVYRLGDKSWVKPEDEFIDKLSKLDSIMDGFKDADGDGVMDLNDKDNKTPAGAMVYGNGAPIDTDGDGVPDHLDKERLSPCTQVDADGVALDSDKDGVNDCKDAEPNSEADCQVDVKGKCIDTKSSAVPTPTSDGGAVTSGLPSVFFELNASSIDYRNYPTLTQVAQFLKSNPKVNLVLVGHTDVSGTDDYNKALGQKRAQSVADHLVKIYGIDKSRITVTSKGASEPLAKTTTARVNRRVDFLIGK